MGVVDTNLHKLRGLLEAQRLGMDDYASDIETLWEKIKADYDGTTGGFASKAAFTSDDLAVILGALNTLRLFSPNQDPVLVSEANTLLSGFFEATTRVLQLSAPPKVLGDGTPVLKGMYEATSPNVKTLRRGETKDYEDDVRLAHCCRRARCRTRPR